MRVLTSDRHHRPMADDPQNAVTRSDLPSWTLRGAGLALGAAIVVGLINLGLAAGGVLILVFVAILLASALEPMVGLIRDHLPLGRGATILVVYLTFFVTVIGLALVVVPAAIGQGQEVLDRLPTFIEQDPRLGGHPAPDGARRIHRPVDRFGERHPDQARPAETRSGRPGRDRRGRGGGDPDDPAHDRLLLARGARPLAALRPVVRPGGQPGRRPRWLERDRDAARPVGPRAAHPDGHDGSRDRPRLHDPRRPGSASCSA